jgi:hypothetical protein
MVVRPPNLILRSPAEQGVSKEGSSDSPGPGALRDGPAGLLRMRVVGGTAIFGQALGMRFVKGISGRAPVPPA